jgi:hypothetical protein
MGVPRSEQYLNLDEEEKEDIEVLPYSDLQSMKSAIMHHQQNMAHRYYPCHTDLQISKP